MDRQEYMLTLVLNVCDHQFTFDTFEDCSRKFKEIINIMRQMNYSEFQSEQFKNYLDQLHKALSNEQ